jgi:hypothetical protein
MTIDRIAERQLNLGPAGFFRAEAESPPGNQVVVRAGFLFAGAYRVYDRFTGGDQTSAGFTSVSGAGLKRYDLVYIDVTGAVQIAVGTEVAVASPVFQGAPGFTAGPDLPDQAIPVAYVLVTEIGAVTVTATDITGIAGIFYLSRDLDGYLIDKGALGAAPTGTSDVVTALFVGETPGGTSSIRGIITSPPANYVGIVDQAGDEMLHITVGSVIYGRITEAGGIWTLTYFYLNASGVETAIVTIETEVAGGAPTDVKLVGTPKVFSRNDPARPLFDSTVYRLRDQVAGDIPDATTTVRGKVLYATDGETTALEAVQGSDSRLTGIRGRRNSGAATARRPQYNFIEGSNISIAIVDDGGDDEVEITIAATGGAFPGYGTGVGSDTAGGSAGASSLVSRTDHRHDLSTDYRISSVFDAVEASTGGPFSVSLPGGHTAEFGFLFSVHFSTDIFNFGFARRSPLQQFCLMIDGDGGNLDTVNSSIGFNNQGATATWTASFPTTNSMTVTQTAGAVNINSRLLGLIGNRY